MHNFFIESLRLHQRIHGKIAIVPKIEVNDTDDLSRVYSPGVAEPCMAIVDNPEMARTLTIKGNSVAVVSDGSAVLGLGNIGALAAIPVMEGKAMLFKIFADVDAFPICLDTQDTDEIVDTVRRIAPVFGGINLEDISAPRSFEIEARLQDLGIPVFHDDQHGTAIVCMAAIINACKVTGRRMEDINVVINGAGAAGVTIAKLLKCIGNNPLECRKVNTVIMCDSHGIIHRGRTDLNYSKKELLMFTNLPDIKGDIRDALRGADVFIGVSKGNILKAEDIATMAKDPIVLALANPIPEIMPDEAKKGGAAVVATGRSDYPNQVNNVLAFPGIFRGALDAHAKRITPHMKLAAALAIAGCVTDLSREMIIPGSLDKHIAQKVAEAVRRACLEEVM